MFLKSKLHLKYLTIFLILNIFFISAGKVFASSEPLVVCTNAGSNPFSFPNHMATSCSTAVNLSNTAANLSANIPLKAVSTSGGVETLTGQATLAFDINIKSFALLKYFNSIDSNGTPYNSGFGNPYTPFGYIVEKLGIDPYVSFTKLENPPVAGLGGFNFNQGSTTPSSNMTVNITSSNAQSSSVGVAFFPVPQLGTAADLFTLGSTYILDDQYNPLQLPNSSVLDTAPSSQFGSANQTDLSHKCASFSVSPGNNPGELTCKLLSSYGNPYNPTPTTNDTIGGYILSNGANFLSDIANFFSSIGTAIANTVGLGPGSPIQSISSPTIGYCPTNEENRTDAITSVNNNNNPISQSTPFTINVSESCKIGSCQNSYTYSISPNLYLQGLNRILADEWYMEASLDEGQPIGHTNITAWKDYVNPNTGYLHKAVLSAMQNNGTYNGQTAQTIETNLFDGIGINVQLNASLVPYSPNACLNNSGSTSQAVSYNFPWLGDAPIIQQNLDIHKFQPYFSNTPPGSTSNSGVSSPLPAGEYYIKDRSQFPDPLLLYLIYVGSLSANDPVVSAALGSYNPFACIQGTQTTLLSSVTQSNGTPVTGGGSSTTGGGSSSLYYKNPFRNISGLQAERIDQGVDYSGTGPVYALGSGVITRIHAQSNSGWGTYFIEEYLTSGPAKGLYTYVAEGITPSVIAGDSVTYNTVIGYMNGGIETGWAANGVTDVPMGHSEFNQSSNNSTAYGINYNNLLVSLGAKPASLITQSGNQNIIIGSPGSVAPNWPQWKFN